MERYELIKVGKSEDWMKCQRVKSNGKQCGNRIAYYASIRDNEKGVIYIIGQNCLEELTGIETWQVEKWKGLMKQSEKEYKRSLKAEKIKEEERRRTERLQQIEEDSQKMLSVEEEDALKRAELKLKLQQAEAFEQYEQGNKIYDSKVPTDIFSNYYKENNNE